MRGATAAWLRAVFASALVAGAVTSGAPASASERLVVGNSASWVPYAFVDASGEPRGVLVDLWRRVGSEAGVEITFEFVDWKTSLELAERGAVDVHGGLTRTRARAAYLDFSQPLFRVSTQLFARRDAGIGDLAGIGSGTVVGVVDGTVEQRFLAEYYAHVVTRPFTSSEAMLAAAVDGVLDAFVTDDPTGQYRLIQLEAVDAFMAVDTLYTEAIHAAVPAGDTARLALIDAYLDRIGEAERRALLDRWIVPARTWPPWLLPALGAAAAGATLLAILLHYAALQRAVRRRTHDLNASLEALRAANAELERRAHVDPLTAVANRRRFVDEARRAIDRARRYGRPAALVLVDVDRLKWINDRYGHLVGDAALVRVADTLTAGLRTTDLVARWGGDEFALLLPETDAAAATATAERLVAAVAAERLSTNGGYVTLGVSAGTAAYAGGELEGWVEDADAALYLDKARRRGGRPSDRARHP